MRNHFRKVFISSILAIIPAVQTAGQTEPFIYTGMADASAAIALSDDTFVVASDESLFVPVNRSKGENVLFVYRVGEPRPLYTISLERAVPSGTKNNELDIEGAARIGERIYWIASHGHNRDGEMRPDRYNFFATDISKNGKVTLAGGNRPLLSYKNLLADLINDTKYERFELSKLHRSRIAPKEGGVNIEGLAATPNGHLLIGFRSPVIKGMALIAPLTNPNEVVTQAKKAIFDQPIEMDLGGLGIRDIVFRPKQRDFLIIGGPVSEIGTSYLFRWNGEVSASGIAVPQRLDEIDLSGLIPEAIIVYPNSESVQILSDDGSLKIPTGGSKAVENKSLTDRQRSFRSIWVKP